MTGDNIPIIRTRLANKVILLACRFAMVYLLVLFWL
jgi:hypothetical protein